jgi:UDP-N-acetylmuramoyl-tripeptide--D-alanyl-D-alanine ligase
MKLSLEQVAGFIGARGGFDAALTVSGYSIDSRTIAQGELFFAVRGERLDGHDFVDAALQQGAAGAVIGEDQAPRFAERGRLLPVQNPLLALQALATRVRSLWGGPLIAVTGSAGKTTTKEMIARLLAARYRVLKSEGNLNNHFGLPLQLLRLEPEHEIAVAELGMSHHGEITALAGLALPSMGVVTNVGPVHLSFFRSVAEIARAKKELIDALKPEGVAVLNADDEYVSQFGRNFPGRVVTYGLHNPADVCGERLEDLGLQGMRFDLVVAHESYRVTLPLLGMHNVYNALAAAAVAVNRGIAPEVAAAELGHFEAVDKRGQMLEIAGATVINDCYNSNPKALDSMVDALAGMAPAREGRRIVVAGEMLELGPAGEELHRRSGQHMAERGIDVLVGVRGLAKFLVEGARQPREGAKPVRSPKAEFLETPELAGEWLAHEVRPGDVVLLKASRGVRLERALEVWQAKTQQLAALLRD